jgi:hypothetical protein
LESSSVIVAFVAFVVVVVAFIGEGGLSSIVVEDSDGGGVGIHSQYVEKPSLIGYR